jgi:pimeloyl-ACP methyl ester carboxylesterase
MGDVLGTRTTMIHVNGASIYHEVRGEGPPIVLISGFTCDHTLWKPVVKLLAKHFQVIRFDNRGVGRTKDHAKILSAELLAEDVRGLIHALGLKKPHIIGQSEDFQLKSCTCHCMNFLGK